MAQLLSDLANIGQIVEALVAVILLFYAFFFSRELREAIKVRHLDGLQFVKELIGTPEASEARRWVYSKLARCEWDNSPPNEWALSPQDHEKARAICRDFDTIGMLCRHALLPSKIIIETYSRNILQMWSLLSPIIYLWRQQLSDPDYFAEFEWLATEARKKQHKLAKRRRRKSRGLLVRLRAKKIIRNIMSS